jgi:hypothetical protein
MHKKRTDETKTEEDTETEYTEIIDTETEKSVYRNKDTETKEKKI